MQFVHHSLYRVLQYNALCIIYYFLNLFCVTGLQKKKGAPVYGRRSCRNQALYPSTLPPIYLRQFLVDSTEQKTNLSGQVQVAPSGKKMRLITFFSLVLSLGGLGGLGW
jgi:hypothetical protein